MSFTCAGQKCVEAVTLQCFTLQELLVIRHELSFGARHNDHNHCIIARVTAASGHV